MNIFGNVFQIKRQCDFQRGSRPLDLSDTPLPWVLLSIKEPREIARMTQLMER